MAVSYNIKTGADTSCYFSREVTQSDSDYSEENLGLIKDSVEQDTDYYEYPVLVRRTGDSLKGTTDNIESNELRKGRTKSAPRKGNSSSEGSLDFEFSPETYDDILESALRDKFKPWTSDTDSPTNLDKKQFAAGKFATKKMVGSEVQDDERTLLGAIGDSSTNAVIQVPASELNDFEIAELDCGTQDIRFDVVKQFGGVEGEDLYQDFEHQCVNSIDMSITPGQIVTGSFSFMGSNNPDLLPKEEVVKFNGDGSTKEFTVTDKPTELNYVKIGDNEVPVTPSGSTHTVTENFTGDGTKTEFTLTSASKPESVTVTVDGTATTEFTYNSTEGKVTFNSEPANDAAIVISGQVDDDCTYDATTGKVKFASAPATGTENIVVSYNGVVKVLAGRFKSSKTGMKVSEWIDDLPKKGTSTDQYTAQQGFLYINGERVRYGSNLSFSLNNGLSKTFAIFEKDAIAMSPLSLDITGSLGVYLIKGYSEKLYNMCTGDKDVEVLFCFQDKEEKPENLYVVQIFKTKFTSADMSSGAENLEVTLPIQSFEERAMRIFRLRKRKPIKVVAGAFVTNKLPVTVTLSTAPVELTESFTATDGQTEFEIAARPDAVTKVTVNNTEKTEGTDFNYNASTGKVVFDSGLAENDAVVVKYSTWNINKPTVSYKVGTNSAQNVNMASVAVTNKAFTVDIPCNDDDKVEVTVSYNGKSITKSYTA